MTSSFAILLQTISSSQKKKNYFDIYIYICLVDFKLIKQKKKKQIKQIKKLYF